MTLIDENVNSSFTICEQTTERLPKDLEVLQDAIDGKLNHINRFKGLGGMKNLNQNVSKLRGLTEAEKQSLLKNSKTAYFTPDIIVDAIYKMIQILGFKGGKILEPSCGTGAFFGRMPSAMKKNSNIIGVELDQVTANIAQNCYPDVTIFQQGFENFNQGNFDLIIGNPPYGSAYISDSAHPDLNQAIHHYFMAKSIRLLKEGGLLAMVIPCYVLDNTHNHLREKIAEYGELVHAIRLPDCMFSNAKITVDLVIFKRVKNPNTDWVKSVKIKLKNGKIFSISNYFASNPENIVGEIDSYEYWLKSENQKRSGLKCVGDIDLVEEKLPGLIEKFRIKFTPKSTTQNGICAMISQLDACLESLRGSLSKLQISLSI